MTSEGFWTWDSGCTGLCHSERQTVPRAELTAIVQVVRAVCPESSLTVVCDHANHVKAWRSGLSHCLQLSNADLWWELFQALRVRTASFTLVHVPSHVLDDDVKLAKFGDVLQWEHVFINAIADSMASARALTCQVSDWHVKHASELLDRAESILLRSAAVCLMSCSIPNNPERRVEKLSISRDAARACFVDRLLQGSTHQFRFAPLGFKCTACGLWARSGERSFFRRLKSHCLVTLPLSTTPPPPDPVVARRRKVLPHPPIEEGTWSPVGLSPAPFRVQEAVLAGRVLHPSHQIWRKGVFTFCGRCGCWAQQQPRGLLSLCVVESRGPHALSNHQQVSLARLRRGQPPQQGVLDWGDLTRAGA